MIDFLGVYHAVQTVYILGISIVFLINYHIVVKTRYCTQNSKFGNIMKVTVIIDEINIFLAALFFIKMSLKIR